MLHPCLLKLTQHWISGHSASLTLPASLSQKSLLVCNPLDQSLARDRYCSKMMPSLHLICVGDGIGWIPVESQCPGFIMLISASHALVMSLSCLGLIDVVVYSATSSKSIQQHCDNCCKIIPKKGRDGHTHMPKRSWFWPSQLSLQWQACKFSAGWR